LAEPITLSWKLLLDFVRNFDSYVPFPGIGAIIRIPNAERDKAISSSVLDFEIRIPPGTISYKVTDGLQ
jgi:hypothetical protein